MAVGACRARGSAGRRGAAGAGWGPAPCALPWASGSFDPWASGSFDRSVRAPMCADAEDSVSNPLSPDRAARWLRFGPERAAALRQRWVSIRGVAAAPVAGQRLRHTACQRRPHVGMR